MVRFRHVLLPTDFSDLARNAARFARSIAEEYGAVLHVLHVMSPEVQPFPAPDIGMGVLALPPDEDQARRYLESFVREAVGATSVKVVTQAQVGAPVSEITRYACDNHVDLIVIGTHARGLVTRIFLGSVSKAVMEHAPCAVLMVPLRAKEEPM
jgi:universal stress protein A